MRLDAARFALIVKQRDAAVALAEAAVETAAANVALYQAQLDRQEWPRGSAAFSGARSEDAGAKVVPPQRRPLSVRSGRRGGIDGPPGREPWSGRCGRR